MNRTLLTISVFVISFLLFGCSEQEVFDESFTIKFGSECGWCAGHEYITISKTKVDYMRNIPCGDNKGIITKSQDLCSCDWDEITSSFDYSRFKKLKYNDCNVCADGCDEVILITENESSHELRYSFSAKVEGMENLREILSEIMKEMREMN